MNVWVYNSRNGNHGVFAEHEFAAARKRQDEDNRCTVEDALEEGWDVSGSEDDGYFSIDDGGSIQLFYVEGTI